MYFAQICACIYTKSNANNFFKNNDEPEIHCVSKNDSDKQGDKSNRWSLRLSLSQLVRRPSEVWYSVAVVQDTVDRKSPSAVEIFFTARQLC